MSGFLLGILTGTVADGSLSYAKNPLSSNSIRSDVKDPTDNFNDSVHRVKTIYGELEEKRMKQPEKGRPEDTDVTESPVEDEEIEVSDRPSLKDKTHDLVDAFSAASFKAAGHDCVFAAVKNKLNEANEDLEDVNDDVKDDVRLFLNGTKNDATLLATSTKQAKSATDQLISDLPQAEKSVKDIQNSLTNFQSSIRPEADQMKENVSILTKGAESTINGVKNEL